MKPTPEQVKRVIEDLPLPENVKRLRILRATDPRRYWKYVFLASFSLLALICISSLIISSLTGWSFLATVVLLLCLRYIFT